MKDNRREGRGWMTPKRGRNEELENSSLSWSINIYPLHICNNFHKRNFHLGVSQSGRPELELNKTFS